MNKLLPLAAHHVIKQHQAVLHHTDLFTCVLMALYCKRIGYAKNPLRPELRIRTLYYVLALNQWLNTYTVGRYNFINEAINFKCKKKQQKPAKRHLRLHWLSYLKYGSAIVRTRPSAFQRTIELHQE